MPAIRSQRRDLPRRPGDTALSVLVPPGRLRSPQGLVVSPDGRRLYVSDYGYGIAMIDLATAPSRRLESDAADDARRHRRPAAWRRRLIAIQNGTSPRRILYLDLSRDGARIDRVERAREQPSRLGRADARRRSAATTCSTSPTRNGSATAPAARWHGDGAAAADRDPDRSAAARIRGPDPTAGCEPRLRCRAWPRSRRNLAVFGVFRWRPPPPIICRSCCSSASRWACRCAFVVLPMIVVEADRRRPALSGQAHRI